MPTPITINSIIDKLSAQPNRISALQFGTTRAKRKLSELKTRVPQLYIPETSFMVLATFLQNIDLTLFTDEELALLLKFDYAFIENKTVVSIPQKQNLNKPYYDSSGTLINVGDETRLTVDRDFQLLHTINSTLSVEFLISFILTQV